MWDVILGLIFIAFMIILAAPSTRGRGRWNPIKTQRELEEEARQEQHRDKQIQRYCFKSM